MSDHQRIEFEEEHDEPHGEPWLVSYADLMTLLFGFFVLMYFFASQAKQDNWEQVRKNIAHHFGGDYVDRFDKIKEEIKAALKENDELLERVEITATANGIMITFQSTILFDLGKAEIREPAKKPVATIVDLLKLKGEKLHIEIEGHTDNLPISTYKFPSNWELSAARAAAIIRHFESKGFAREHLRATGFADTKPLFPNTDENGNRLIENMSKNRRVVIRVSNFHDFTEAKKLNTDAPDKSKLKPLGK